MLKQCFPEHCREILTVAQYMLSDGNVLYYIDAYTETHKTAEEEVLSDTGCSKMLSSLRREDMMLFFREWMTHRKRDEYIACDLS